MSTLKFSASHLAYVSRESYSGWSSAGAIQGSTAGNTHPRVGAMQFSGLRETDWAGQEIGAVRMTLTFAQAGLNREKTVYLWRGARSGISGAGSGMRGAFIGGAATGGAAYSSVRTLVFSENENAEAFANLIAWLQQDTTDTLAVYADEAPAGYDWSANYLQIKAAEMEIDFEPRGSRGTLDRTDVYAGGTIALTIAPMEAEGAVTHLVNWQMDGAAGHAVQLAAGETEAAFTVPLEWLSCMPDSIRGAARCVLTTLVDGEESASRELPFTVVCPAEIVPEFTAAAEPSGTADGYYQRIGGARLSFESASAPYGASIVQYAVSGAENFSADAQSAVTPDFAQPGLHAYTLTLTDSRGRSASQTVEIDVQATALPQIDVFSVQRYAAAIGDSGEEILEPSTDGDRVWVTVSAGIDPADGSNVPAAAIEYGPEGGQTVSVPLDWTSGAAYSTENNRALIAVEISPDAAYHFTLTVSDCASSVSAFARVEKSWAIMHFAGSGCGVGVGMYSRATEDAPRFESAWPAAFHGGIEGVTSFTEEEAATGGTWIDGLPVFRKIVAIGAVAADSALETPIGVTADELGTVIRMQGMARTPYEGFIMPLPNPSSDHSFMVQLEISGTNTTPAVRVVAGKSREITDGFVIVEYTKRT